MSQTQALLPLAAALAQTRILVIGDVMLDRFVYGQVDRISPESPVPVLVAGREAAMLGGAGNVIANLRGLGAQAVMVAVTGNDADGRAVRDLCASIGAETGGLVADAARPTIVKTRFLAGHQQLLRLDEEDTAALAADIEAALLEKIAAHLPGCGAVVMSDYGKGTLSRVVIAAVLARAKDAGIPVLVDPKGADYARYKGASVVTPNRKELAEATAGMPTSSDADIEAAAQAVLNQSGIAAVVATRSQDGMTVIEPGQSPLHLKARAVEVFDVSGAGDTVIATIAAALAAGSGLADAARLANVAAGLVVAKVGTAPVLLAELQDALRGAETSSTHQAPLRGWDSAGDEIRRWQARGLKVGFTNGCFDIIHAGHVNYLNEARAKCDRLVLALNSDASVRLLKGPTRPVNSETDRATVIGALGAVDLVVLFGAAQDGEDNTPREIIALLQPDIFFKGGDYTPDQLPEAKTVQAYGGEVCIMGLTEGRSTTATIAKMSGKAA